MLHGCRAAGLPPPLRSGRTLAPHASLAKPSSLLQGSLGTVLVQGTSACQAGACAYNSGCAAGRYTAGTGATRVCALCPPGSSCAGGTAASVTCATGKSAKTGSTTCSNW